MSNTKSELKPIKPEVLDYSAKVKKQLSIDNQTGICTGDLQKVYDENLPEGITPEVVKKISEYDGTVVSGTVHAVGEMAVEAMAKHSGINKVTGDFTFGHRASLNIAVDRKKEVVNNFSPERETIVKHGAVREEVHYRAGRGGGQLSAVKQAILAHGAEALKK